MSLVLSCFGLLFSSCEAAAPPPSSSSATIPTTYFNLLPGVSAGAVTICGAEVSAEGNVDGPSLGPGPPLGEGAGPFPLGGGLGGDGGGTARGGGGGGGGGGSVTSGTSTVPGSGSHWNEYSSTPPYVPSPACPQCTDVQPSAGA